MRKVTLVLALLVAGASLLLSSDCAGRSFFRRNPHLRLILTERPRGSGRARSLYYPVWSPDGSAIYYLCTSDRTQLWSGGSLWRVASDGADPESLASGPFCAVTVARDGQRLVLCTGRRAAGGRLAVLDLASRRMETLETSQSDLIDLAVGRADPTRVYYCSMSRGLYRISMDGSGETLWDAQVTWHFDLTPTDSVVTKSNIIKVSVSPDGQRIAYPGVIEDCAENDLFVATVDSTATTRLDANPYEWSQNSFPSWSPDGKKLIFSAQELLPGDPTIPAEAELWILEELPGAH